MVELDMIVAPAGVDVIISVYMFRQIAQKNTPALVPAPGYPGDMPGARA
jgi:hypothetical protein